MALAEEEAARLLPILLEGFGYQALVGRNMDSIMDQLGQTSPFLAVVDLRLEDAEAICQMVDQRPEIDLMVLCPEEEADPALRATSVGAAAWLPAKASMEQILSSLRTFAEKRRSVAS